jgi:hypothetical protein
MARKFEHSETIIEQLKSGMPDLLRRGEWTAIILSRIPHGKFVLTDRWRNL